MPLEIDPNDPRRYRIAGTTHVTTAVTLGRRLREVRDARLLSASVTAVALDVRESWLTTIERGWRRPDAETLERMASLYGCSVEWLLREGDD